jgi:hypothetical protein
MKLWLGLVLTLATAGISHAVPLRNSHQITGRLKGLNNGVYTVVTDHGTQAIKAADVKQVSRADRAAPSRPIHSPPHLKVTAKPGQLRPDTTVWLTLVDRLKSGSVHRGDRITFRVDQNVRDRSGAVLIRKGAPAYGRMVTSRTKGLSGKGGNLAISLERTIAVDGQTIRLRGTRPTGAATMAPGTLLTGYVNAAYRVSIRAVPSPPLVGAMEPPVETTTSAPPLESLLTLQNGDQITGEVEGPEDGVYTVRTDIGAVKIQVADVAQITTAPDRDPSETVTTPRTQALTSATQHVLTLRNGGTITGHVEELKNGVYTVTTARGKMKVRAGDVRQLAIAIGAK